jgi:hypothetical protein
MEGTQRNRGHFLIRGAIKFSGCGWPAPDATAKQEEIINLLRRGIAFKIHPADKFGNP